MVGPQPLNVESTGTGIAPGPIGEVSYTIQRGRGPKDEGCGKQSGTSCDDIGTLTLHFAPSADPDSDTSAVGYRLRVTGGALPPGLQLPSEPLVGMGVAPQSEGTLFLTWIDGASDDQESVDFSLTLTPVDADGNTGPTSPAVHVHDEGSSGGGCNVHRHRAGRVAAPPALVALALLRRRRK